MLAGWDNRDNTPPQSKGGYNVELVGWVDSVGDGIGVFVAAENGMVIYADVGDSFAVIDFSDPSNPSIYKKMGHDSLGNALLLVIDTFLYSWWEGYFGGPIIEDLDAYNISDPLNPVFVKNIYYYEGSSSKPPMRWDWPAWPRDTILYAVGGYKSFNFKDPLNPVLISYITGSGNSSFFLYPYIYTYQSDTPYSEYWIFDVSDPANMFLVYHDSVLTGGMYASPWGALTTVSVWKRPSDRKRFMYLLGWWDMYCFDVTDPSAPVQLKWWKYYNWGGYVWGSLVYGDRLYCAEDKYPSREDGLVIRSLSPDPTNPSVVGYHYHETGDSVQDPFNPMFWVNGYVVAGGTLTNPWRSALFIYHYSGDPLPPGDTTEYIDWITAVYKWPGLKFSLSQEAHVSFSLFNISGQKACERDHGTLGPGPHRVELPGLKPGVYSLHLRVNTELIQKKLIFSQEGGFIEPEERPQLGQGFLAPPPWEVLGHRDEKPEREIRVLPLSLSCRESAEITLYTTKGTERLSLSPDLTDTLFRKAILANVLNQGFYSWVPGDDPVLYAGEGVYAPGYYRVFYLDPPAKTGNHLGADTIALCGKGGDEEKGGYLAPIEDAKSPWAIRVYQSGRIDFYARVILLPDPRHSELRVRVGVHLWAVREGIVPEKVFEPSLSRDPDLLLRKDGEVAGQ